MQRRQRVGVGGDFRAVVEDSVAGHVIPAESGDMQRGAAFVVGFADLRDEGGRRRENQRRSVV